MTKVPLVTSVIADASWQWAGLSPSPQGPCPPCCWPVLLFHPLIKSLIQQLWQQEFKNRGPFLARADPMGHQVRLRSPVLLKIEAGLPGHTRAVDGGVTALECRQWLGTVALLLSRCGVPRGPLPSPHVFRPPRGARVPRPAGTGSCEDLAPFSRSQEWGPVRGQ